METVARWLLITETGFIAVLFLVIKLLALFTFIDACLRKSAAFEAANKQTKKFWLLILGLAVCLVFIPGMGFFMLIAVVAVLVYLVDARPAIKQSGGALFGKSKRR